MKEVACPSCGAPVQFRSKVSLIAVCPSCQSQAVQGDLDVSKVGKVGALQDDGTPLQVMSTGNYMGVSFTVIGRMQLRFPAGFWNEWFVAFNDGRQGWVGEAAGLYAVSFKTPTEKPLPNYDKLRVGERVALNGEAYEVRDKRVAEYLSAEGELPFQPPLGVKAPLADLVASGSRFATLDYSEQKAILFLGQYREFSELNFQNLREIEGWQP
jgi:hypothetical protein